MISIPRIVIAGTHSGCGKTTVASGIMAALVARGFSVQPFKVGPDFIDPSHHTLICGRASRNLDPFMMGEAGCRETFIRASQGADIAVIEGVMGMFDGIDGSDVSSTAHVARILKSPALLVADVKGMSRSVHALVKGFHEFDPGVNLAGVIYNRVGSSRHREMIALSGSVPSFGWIPRKEEIGMTSRHLGLVMAHESESLKAAGPLLEECADIDGIISAAKTAPPMDVVLPFPSGEQNKVRIGIACDRAFCFYYQDNLDALTDAGADLVFFSPLAEHLPEVNAVYVGGGYPELHLPALESSPCTSDLKRYVDQGLPVYGECGGLMYLTGDVQADKTYRMAGVLPAGTEMTKKIQALGYVKGLVITDSPVFSRETPLSGHEFHYSRLLPDSDVHYAMELSRGKGIDSGKDGIIAGSALGAYTHAYFTKTIACDFVKAAIRFSQD